MLEKTAFGFSFIAVAIGPSDEIAVTGIFEGAVDFFGDGAQALVDAGVDRDGFVVLLDPDGNALGYEDVFTKIAMCRNHYRECGLGADFVDRFIR